MAATAVAVLMVLAPGLRPDPLAVVAVCGAAAVLLALRAVSLHRHDDAGGDGRRPPGRFAGGA